MEVKRVAVVTGSNKGVGFGIVRGLCKDFDGDVILTARDETRGLAAVKDLEGEGLNPKFHQLDITDAKSIERFKDYLLKNYQGLDVLVNNAGVVSKVDYFRHFKPTGKDLESSGELFENLNPESFGLEAAKTIQTNYTSQLDVCRSLFPLLRPHARVCNVSSLAAKFGFSKCSAELKEKFLKPDLTMDELSSIMDQFVQASIEGETQEKGFHENAYYMSKLGLTVMTSILQRELDKQGADDIVVNSVSPGFVNTDMTQGKGKLSIDEGAITPLMACLLPPNITSPRGLLLWEKKIVNLTADDK